MKEYYITLLYQPILLPEKIKSMLLLQNTSAFVIRMLVQLASPIPVQDIVNHILLIGFFHGSIQVDNTAVKQWKSSREPYKSLPSSHSSFLNGL